MAIGRQSKHPGVHEGTAGGDADERSDSEDQIAEADTQDAAGEPAVRDQKTARRAGARPQEDDLLIQLSP